MTRRAQAYDLVTMAVERLAQCTQTVRRIGHTVKQQHATGSRGAGQFEAVVPVGLPAIRVCSTAGTVALQGMGGAGGIIGVDLFIQLPEQPLLQFQVVVKVVDLLTHHLFGKLFGEYLCVPGFQRWSVATRPDVNHRYKECQDNTGDSQ